MTTLYTASVPVCLHYLGRLDGLVAKAQSHVTPDDKANDKANDNEELTLLAARLASDMLPFVAQVKTAAFFTLRICYPLAGLPTPAFGSWPDSLTGLRQRIVHTVDLLQALKAEDFNAADSRHISSQAGDAELLLPAHEFLCQYAMPNFLFHLSMAYAILRAQGVPLGKGDFDGYHVYPARL
jgi:uncharacterized protein